MDAITVPQSNEKCLNTCLNIPLTATSLTKTITIRDEIHRKLLKIKRENESFSELFDRLVEGISPTEVLKGLRGCIEFNENEKDKMLSEIHAARAERRI